jgi:hypothetical protein
MRPQKQESAGPQKKLLEARTCADTSVEKRERENEWNKVFKDKKSTCMRVMKQVMKDAGVKRHKQ